MGMIRAAILPMARWRLALLLLLPAATACAPVVPIPNAAPSIVEEPVQKIDKGPTSYEGDIGGLSQEDVEEQFQALRPRLVDCVRKASGRLTEIGGRVTLRMRMDRSGNVRWAYLTDSTLGDRDTERCVLREVQSRTWPRPLSGEGLAESSFEVEPAEVPRTLPSYKASLLAQRARVATSRCRKGIRGAFQATVYVGHGGDVIAVGVAPPNETAEQASDCVAEAVRELRVGAVAAMDRNAVAKASFPIR
jgi:hypothetical protein